jgi:phosphoribosylanthranilate isomerase
MMVKICGITNREDALAAIEGGAAALGFNFYPASPRYITPEEAAEICAGLPAGWKVGVFVDEAPEQVLRIARQAGLDIAQLHGSESRENYPRGIRVWKAIRVRDGQVPERLDFPAEAVLLDGPASGQSFDWRNIPGMSRFAGKLILAGGLDAGNVRRAIEQAHPWGVDACSRLESAPGRKDRFKMAEFLKAALAATL